MPSLRTAASCSASRCAKSIGSGINDRRFAAGVAEHQTLVPGALQIEEIGGFASPAFKCYVDTLCDVRRLLTNGDRYSTRATVETFGRGVVANVDDAFTDDPRNLNV